LQKYSNKKVIFAGAPGTEVEPSALARDSATTMNGTIMFCDQKQPHIQVRWEKVAYDAKWTARHQESNRGQQSGPVFQLALFFHLPLAQRLLVSRCAFLLPK
jgi:hypothetical protein